MSDEGTRENTREKGGARAFRWLARRSWFAATVLAGGMKSEARDRALRIVEEERWG